MKSHSIFSFKWFALILLLYPFFSLAQINAGSVVMSTQAEVDAFDYEEVVGTVLVQNGPTDLSPLIKLKKAGRLILKNLPVTSLNGLDSVRVIGDDLQINRCLNLTDISALRQLESVKEIRIVDNALLRNLDGFSNLQGELDRIFFNFCEFDQIDGLSGITGIREEIRIEGVEIPQLNGLKNIDHCRNLNILGCTVTDLDSLDGMDVEGSLSLRNLPFVREIHAFQATDTLHNLVIWNDYDSLRLPGLLNLKSVRRVFIQDHFMTDLDWLSLIGGHLGYLELNDCRSLTDISALQHITQIDTLRLDDNRNLTSLQGLNGLIEADYLQIVDMPLTNLNDLGNLRRINQQLFLEFNDNLAQIDSLIHIETIGGSAQFKSIHIDWNKRLTNLDGLAGLKGVHASGIQVQDNYLLENIEGLSGITSLNGTAHIRNNPLLEHCCVTQRWHDAGSSVVLSNNTPDCEQDLLTQRPTCSIVSINSELLASQVSQVYTTDDQLLIRYQSMYPLSLDLYNVQGQKVCESFHLEPQSQEVSMVFPLKKMTPGIYYLRARGEMMNAFKVWIP